MNQTEIVENEEYIHFKGGRYVVRGVAIDATNGAERYVVVYSSVTDKRLFVRSLEEFLEVVLWPDGVMRARFVEAKSF
jgi:hypothetical protein